ncbi:MAG TPA: alpha/beta fold hydrolase, partial [Cryptosporangiaceae bacterium]|nr:alpha/beta fold hydrolase [Cryptosporangiaceae bacterium]
PLGIDVLTPPGAEPLVLAIPYAGASGRAFQAMRRYLPSGCGLALVDLPGHGRRMGEECLRDVDAVVDELLAVVPTLPTPRLLLLGYSLGGSFSYELAARLTEAGTPPEGLIVCGSRSPQTGVGHPPVAHLPSGEPFLRAAVDMGLAVPEMLELPELADSFVGPLQADLAMVETFPHRPRRPPLPVPVCVVGLRGDWVVPEPSLRAWDDLCLDPPLQLRVNGGHLALHEREREFGEAVRGAVEHLLWLGRPAAHPPTGRATTSTSMF